MQLTDKINKKKKKLLNLLSKTAKVNILESCPKSESCDPKPSVSNKSTGIVLPSGLVPIKGFDQIHIPFVQALTVFPTEKPLE